MARPKGIPAWNKGLRGVYKHTEENRKKLGDILRKAGEKTRFQKGKSYSPETQFKKGMKVRLGKKHTPETRKKLRIARLKKPPMTLEQRKNWGLKHSGKNNGKWKGGVSKQDELLRKTIEYRDARRKAFERDHFRCRVCGAGGYMNAHHIKPFRDHLELRNELNNLITLCIECHKIMFKRENLFINYLQGILENGFNSEELSKETTPSQQERLRKALWACVTVKGE